MSAPAKELIKAWLYPSFDSYRNSLNSERQALFDGLVTRYIKTLKTMPKTKDWTEARLLDTIKQYCTFGCYYLVEEHGILRLHIDTELMASVSHMVKT